MPKLIDLRAITTLRDFVTTLGALDASLLDLPLRFYCWEEDLCLYLWKVEIASEATGDFATVYLKSKEEGEE